MKPSVFAAPAFSTTIFTTTSAAVATAVSVSSVTVATAGSTPSSVERPGAGGGSREDAEERLMSGDRQEEREVGLSLPSCFIQFVRTDGGELKRAEPEWQDKIHPASWSLLN